MLRTHASTLALTALLTAGMAGGASAQTTTEEEDAIVVEEEAVEGEAVIVEEEPAEGDAVVVEEEPAEGEAVVVEEETDVEVEEVEVETPVEGQIFEQSPEEVLGTTLMGATVMSPDGEAIGDVDDVIVSSEGEITGVVIGVGGFLGIGEKSVALQYDQIQVSQDEVGDLTFMTNATQEELENAPGFRTLADTQAEVAEPVVDDGAAVEGEVVEDDAVIVEEPTE